MYDWLNSIYEIMRDVLEIIYFISATFIPILLGWISYKISKEANKRDKYNLELTKKANQLLPKFIVTTFERGLEERLHEQLIIKNDRNVHLTSFNMEYKTYIEVEVPYKKYENLIKPVIDYYGYTTGSLLNGNSQFINPIKPNRKHYGNLYRDFLDINKAKNTKSDIYPVMKTYVEVIYTNIMDELYEDQYIVDTSGYKKLTKEENAILQKELKSYSVNFYDVTAEELWNEFAKKNGL